MRLVEEQVLILFFFSTQVTFFRNSAEAGHRLKQPEERCMRQRPMSAYRDRDAGGPPAAGEKPGIDFEAEDEKENDHHRWRARQSRDDPGAKACEATCIFCVGMLFLQVRNELRFDRATLS